MTRSGPSATILLLALAIAAPAQSRTDWENVRQISAGQIIRVRVTDGRDLRGSLQSASDEAVVIETSGVRGKAGTQETLARATVTRVSTKGTNHRLRNAVIGFGGGAVVGLAIGAIGDGTCNPNVLLGCFRPLGKNGLKETVTPLGAVIGAIVGALLPTGGWREVYRTK